MSGGRFGSDGELTGGYLGCSCALRMRGSIFLRVWVEREGMVVGVVLLATVLVMELRIELLVDLMSEGLGAGVVLLWMAALTLILMVMLLLMRNNRSKGTEGRDKWGGGEVSCCPF